VAVEAFLAGRLAFTDIARTIARTMDAHQPVHVTSLETIREADRWAREQASLLAAG
jgi:1-deoxy-D-xylulose-5-phosphate reductoisomerase